MKYNPRIAHQLAMLPGILAHHPLSSIESSQGILQCIHELRDILLDVTGMQEISFAPMAGAHGEFAGVSMIHAYHQARGDDQRTEMLVPDAAHGTNPASAAVCGFTVKEIPTLADGDLDIEALKAMVGPKPIDAGKTVYWSTRARLVLQRVF